MEPSQTGVVPDFVRTVGDGPVFGPPDPVVAVAGADSVGTALVAGALSVLVVTFGIYALFQLFVLADR